jgi:chemosensory pili system protein ChpA (sensor histidine kinase/response regulator)
LPTHVIALLLWHEEHWRYQLGSEFLGAIQLEALLNLPMALQAEQLVRHPALLVRDAARWYQVVLVQALLYSLSLGVKPLGRYVLPIQGIAGATILGDGSVTPVLDLPNLLRHAVRHAPGQELDDEAGTLVERPLPIALVVDDSQSARRALANFVHDLGFEVHTTGDGLEAIASLERQVPDILLVDLEMPRMNGLELAEHIRTHHDTSHLPIIMITSRSTEKHRRNATRAGVDVYLVKPFVEDVLAEHIQQLLQHHMPVTV